MTSEGPHTQQVTVDELANDRRFAIIDVRPQEERDGVLGFLPGSRSFPAASLIADPGLLRRAYVESQPVVLVCTAGHRSLTLADRLAQHGAATLASLTGGLLAWHGSGRAMCGIGQPKADDVPCVDTLAEFSRALKSCFVAEWAQSVAGNAQHSVDPLVALDEVLAELTAAATLDDVYVMLEMLAQRAWWMGHRLQAIAYNTDCMRVAVDRLFERQNRA